MIEKNIIVEEQLKNLEGEIKDVVIVSSSIYANVKNKFVNVNNKRANLEDKKILALFHGMLNCDNDFSRIVKELNYSYSIDVDINDCKYEEEKKQYYKLYTRILQNHTINDIAYYLLESDIIKIMHDGSEANKEKLEILKLKVRSINNRKKKELVLTKKYQ